MWVLPTLSKCLHVLQQNDGIPAALRLHHHTVCKFLRFMKFERLVESYHGSQRNEDFKIGFSDFVKNPYGSSMLLKIG